MNEKLKEAISVGEKLERDFKDLHYGTYHALFQGNPMNTSAALHTLISLAKAALEVELPKESDIEDALAIFQHKYVVEKGIWDDEPKLKKVLGINKNFKDSAGGKAFIIVLQILKECRPILAGYKAENTALKGMVEKSEKIGDEYQLQVDGLNDEIRVCELKNKALKQQLTEMEEAKCRYQKSYGKVTKELWDIKGRTTVVEIAREIYHNRDVDRTYKDTDDLIHQDSVEWERAMKQATAVSASILEGK